MALDTRTEFTENTRLQANDSQAGGSPAHLPTPLDIIRACGVVYGPSAVLDVLALASAGIVAGRAVARLRGNACSSRATRVVEPLAGLGVALTAGYLLAGRPWLRRWGATDHELTRVLPGDSLAPNPAIQSTWSVTINAPAAAVWPWIAQLGQDRGGFYSYAWLENLAGCHLRNADRIHPEWQHRTVGEQRAAASGGRPAACRLRAGPCIRARRLGLVCGGARGRPNDATDQPHAGTAVACRH